MASTLFVPAAEVSSGKSLVMIDAQASDHRGHFIAGLCSGRFRLFDDGVEQQIRDCTVESSPVSVAIVLDASSSMKPAIGLSRSVIRELVQSSDPRDEFSLTLVRDNPMPDTELSQKSDRLLDCLDQAGSGGMTALWDTIYVAALQLKSARNPRRALLVISDGDDNNSRHPSSDLVSLLREMDVAVYAIGVHSGTSRTIATRLYYLECLSRETGGRYFDAGRDFPTASDDSAA